MINFQTKLKLKMKIYECYKMVAYCFKKKVSSDARHQCRACMCSNIISLNFKRHLDNKARRIERQTLHLWFQLFDLAWKNLIIAVTKALFNCERIGAILFSLFFKCYGKFRVIIIKFNCSIKPSHWLKLNGRAVNLFTVVKSKRATHLKH